MITGTQKSLDEIYGMLRGYRNVQVLACGTCVTVCFAGGEKEAETLASRLRIKSRLQGDDRTISVAGVKRQCEWEFLDNALPPAPNTVIVSLACGIGVQAVAERFPGTAVVPGLDTAFLGMPVTQGVWEEKCVACGECIVHNFAGLCPVSRCSKSLLNGPCGGSVGGRCEISRDVPCVWQLIHDRFHSLGQLDRLDDIQPVRDWKSNNAAGPRKIVREDLGLTVAAAPSASLSA
ncbi:MAG: methylenetetrahydrofolate reductase C-terminal domain-containing protein [Chloroflexi bacterium]|nr:methylenetetrahydrofolate reductase C-terminal domain-containing protein [Chloroflexota bacterium]